MKLDTVGAGTISIGPTNATTINIGKSSTGATITIGSPGTGTSTTSVGIQCGTGACNLGSNTLDTGSVNIGNQNAGIVSIQTGTGNALYLGNGGVTNTIQIGNGAGTAVLQTINIGSANTTAGSSDNIKIGSTVAGTLTLQSAGATEAITGSTNIIQTTTSSATAFEVEGSSAVLDVDTTHDRVGIGNATPGYALDVTGDINTSTVYRIAGATMLQEVGTNNDLIGGAGNGSMTGANNVAISVGALADNTSGGNNFALGGDALLANTSGAGNVAIGINALQDNTTANANVGIGQGAGTNLTGSSAAGDTLIGYYAGGGTNLVTGGSDTVIGANDLSLAGITSAANSIVIGANDFYNTGSATSLSGDVIIANNVGTGITGASANYLDIGGVLYGNTSTGTGYLEPSTNSTNAFQVENASGYNELNVNTSTTTATNGTITLGNITTTSGHGVAGSIVLADGGILGFGATLNTATLSANQTITLPNASGTVCLAVTGGGNCSAAGTGYIQDQSSIGTAQAGYFDIAGSGAASTSFLTPDLDALTSGGTLTIGGTNANTVAVGNTTAATTAAIYGGTGTGALNLQTGSGGFISIGTASGTGDTINIGSVSTTNVASTINIGIGTDTADAQDVAIGSIAANSSAKTIIQGGSGSSAVSIQTAASGEISIGSAARANTIVIGNQTSATSLTLYGGTGNISLESPQVIVGTSDGGSGSTNPDLLVLDGDSSSTEPTEVDGAMYYNVADQSFRCGQDGAWVNCGGGLEDAITTNSNTISNHSALAEFSNSGDTYTIPQNGCQTGVVYIITADGYYNTEGATSNLTTELFDNGSGTGMDEVQFTSIGGTASANFQWTAQIQLTCISTTSVMINGNMQAGANFANFDVTGGNARTGPATLSDGSGGDTIGIANEWSSAVTPGGITMTQFIVQRIGP
jgi:filamentous hemagglutinin